MNLDNEMIYDMDKCWFHDEISKFQGCNVMQLFGLMSFPVKSELCNSLYPVCSGMNT